MRHSLILFHKRVMSCFYRYPFFMFQTIPSISKIVASGWVLAMKVEYVFEYVFWIRATYLVMKLDHLIDIVIGNIFRKYFAWLEILGSKRFSFFFYQPTAINRKLVMMILCFLTLLKIRANEQIILYCHHIKGIKGPGSRFQSVQ